MRCSTAVAYLHPAMPRENLAVLTSTQVLRVVCDGHRATGVEADRAGEVEEIQAAREVILWRGRTNRRRSCSSPA